MCTLFRAPIEQVAQSTLTAVSNCNTKKQVKQHYNESIVPPSLIRSTKLHGFYYTSRIFNICLREVLSCGKYYRRAEREYDPFVSHHKQSIHLVVIRCLFVILDQHSLLTDTLQYNFSSLSLSNLIGYKSTVFSWTFLIHITNIW